MNPSAHGPLVLLGGLWVGYFLLHSALASNAVKGWLSAHWPALAPAYRLLYNLLAVLSLLPILLILWSAPGPLLWRWSGAWGWLAGALAILALAGFAWTLRYYRSMDFLGLGQWRRRQSTPADTEDFCLSPLHRWVRHPWYALALVLIWSRDMSGSLLLSAVAISIYLVVGSRLEEQRLCQQFGARYQRYRKRVPGLIPRPWQHLSRQEAAALLNQREGAE